MNGGETIPPPEEPETNQSQASEEPDDNLVQWHSVSIKAPVDPLGSRASTLPEERLYDLTRLISEWVWETDRDGHLTYASARVFDLLGLPAESLIGKSFVQIGQFRGEAPNWNHPFRDHRLDAVAANGHAVVLQLSAVPMFDPQTGSRIGNRGTAKDITSTEEASAALNRQHAFRKVLMDAIPLPVFVKDRAGRYIAVNKAFCEAAGRPSEQILYETMESLLPPDEIEIYQDVEQEILERGGSRYLELSTRFADGKKHQIVLAMSRYGEGQRTSGLIGVVTDVTALRVTEKDLQSSIDALTRSNSELRHFTEVAAHDLQEPVRTVVSYCQLIERTLGNYPDPHLQEYLHFAMSGARRMRDLVNDLTLYASVDRTHKQPHRLDLALIALQAAEDLQRKIQDPDVQITVRKPLPDAFGDQIEIKQVFRHLFENAWKFRNPDRPVQVTVSASAAQPSALALEQAAGSAQDGLEGEGAMVTIAVQDNGIGMAEADLERIFSLFRRLHGQDRFPGTGIGLAVCRKIVERSGGRIWAESLGDQGSRLCFTLPLSRGRAQAPSPLPLAGFSTE